MSSDVLAQVVSRMSREAAFRRAVMKKPMEALAGYDLTPDEIQSLTNPVVDPDIGVDERITKARKFVRD